MARSPLLLSGPRAPAAEGRRRASTRDVLALLAGALALGVGSAWGLMRERPPIGAVQLGVWTSYPRIGSSEIDPYSRAVLTRAPYLPLATGEGVKFVAHRDETGEPLLQGCAYRLSGPTLPSRGWTLTFVDRGERTTAGAPALSDQDILTDERGEIAVTIAAGPRAGPWLPIPAGQPRFSLALRFYETPFTGGVSNLTAEALPRLTRLECRS